MKKAEKVMKRPKRRERWIAPQAEGSALLAQDFGALFPDQHFPTDNLEKLLDFVTENIFKEETLTPPASINITFLSLWKN